MTRLFIRFYLGVLFILFCAWSIQTYVTQQRNEAANYRVIEAALGGGVRLAREKMMDAPATEKQATLEELRRQFDYPVHFAKQENLPTYVQARFQDKSDAVLMYVEEGGFMVAPLRDKQSIAFGPLPSFIGPSQTELMVGLGLVLLLAAGAIALLLQPVTRQLRVVERAAKAFADGDLSVRVDERKVKAAATLAHAFNHMAGRTETMVRTQRELLQAVSHELRTPLSRIHFAVDLIRESKQDRDREERLRSIEDSAGELDALVGELLSYVRLETSEPQLVIDDVALLPVIEQLIDKHSLVHRSVTFEIGDRLQKGDFTLQADRASLERAIGNLVSNAARFATNKVVVDAEETDDGTIINVDDDGPGIAPDDRARAFDPFVRFDQSSRGAGLGLALVRRIVTNHGGSVLATESELGGCRMQSVWSAAAGASRRT